MKVSIILKGPIQRLVCIVFALGFVTLVHAQSTGGTDDLGRTLPTYLEIGEAKERTVAMFYFLWHGDNTSAWHYDLSKIIPQHPEVLNDFNNPHWGGGGMYYWGEPIYGYYRADDYWVHLRSLQLLTDAGVDLLVIDATNRLIYAERANVLMNAMEAIRKQGKTPPKIVFYTNTFSGETMEKVYETFYKKGAKYYHPESWFYLEGKPMILGHSKELQGKEAGEFFTVRESQWPNEPYKENSWPWIEFQREQRVHKNHKGEVEIMNVSVAQHPNPTAGMGGSAFYGNQDNWGRSFRNGKKGNPMEDIIWGYNFQEQWDNVFKKDPPIVFVTGWNEWIATKFESHDDNPEHSWFCDQASPEYSRDIEPTRTGGLKDHYYMQLVGNVRKYKGGEAPITFGDEVTIKGLEDWTKVNVEFTDYIGDTDPRNHEGAQAEPNVTYTNFTGRNDFQTLKVGRDNESIFFYAQTTKSITENNSDNWMRLYLNVDRDYSSGWKGYDFRVIRGNQLQRYVDETWETVDQVDYEVSGNEMMIAMPRSLDNNLLNVLDLEFKWSDNMQDNDDPLDWYVNGDVAPGGRLNFIIKE
ncbi:hypothetical protein [Cyclobacterium marinum]|uniref:hypothetical protein n=1 Tax=Cyclobacterium marinum TaxID=104 RepID=UPI0011EDFBF4|nr:hypothetical protein [Cyclobacterium marinum]MBI0397112.1 hypothetical protein [Cyclobacterium marinum]